MRTLAAVDNRSLFSEGLHEKENNVQVAYYDQLQKNLARLFYRMC